MEAELKRKKRAENLKIKLSIYQEKKSKED
jgi:hypothetical protein